MNKSLKQSTRDVLPKAFQYEQFEGYPQMREPHDKSQKWLYSKIERRDTVPLRHNNNRPSDRSKWGNPKAVGPVDAWDHCPWCHAGVKHYTFSKPWTQPLSRKGYTLSSKRLWQAGCGYEVICTRDLYICCRCGWWAVTQIEDERWDNPIHREVTGRQAVGVLCDLHQLDISAGIEELQRYLLVKYDQRRRIHPRKFEQIVGAVFKGLGFSVLVTNYSGDGGIDVAILGGAGKIRIGVQIKNTRNKIEAEQIRSLAGALYLKKAPAGIFVTSSDFRAGAISTADRYTKMALPIQLWNAKEFYDKLELSTQPLLRKPSRQELNDLKWWSKATNSREFENAKEMLMHGFYPGSAPWESLWTGTRQMPRVYHDDISVT